jgi:hypothetical protein
LKFELKILFLNFENFVHTTRGKWEKLNKKIDLKFENFWPYHQREMKKIEIWHGNLK